MTVAIVTGASRGIGRTIALKLAEDGMDVAVNDIERQKAELEETKAMVEKTGRRSLAFIADVSVESQVQQLVATVVAQFGELNVMISNAGVVSTNRLFDITLEEWELNQSVNLRGMFLCYREAAKQMVKQGKGGKIIGACSLAGHKPSPDALAYGVSKWGVRGLTQGVAQELGIHGINVNCYCPGPVATDLWDKLDESRGVKQGLPKWQSFHDSVNRRSVMKKAATPEDIADGVAFLAGPNSRMITGQSLIIDGGMIFS